MSLMKWFLAALAALGITVAIAESSSNKAAAAPKPTPTPTPGASGTPTQNVTLLPGQMTVTTTVGTNLQLLAPLGSSGQTPGTIQSVSTDNEGVFGHAPQSGGTLNVQSASQIISAAGRADLVIFWKDPSGQSQTTNLTLYANAVEAAAFHAPPVPTTPPARQVAIHPGATIISAPQNTLLTLYPGIGGGKITSIVSDNQAIWPNEPVTGFPPSGTAIQNNLPTKGVAHLTISWSAGGTDQVTTVLLKVT